MRRARKFEGCSAFFLPTAQVTSLVCTGSLLPSPTVCLPRHVNTICGFAVAVSSSAHQSYPFSTHLWPLHTLHRCLFPTQRLLNLLTRCIPKHAAFAPLAPACRPLRADPCLHFSLSHLHLTLPPLRVLASQCSAPYRHTAVPSANVGSDRNLAKGAGCTRQRLVANVLRHVRYVPLLLLSVVFARVSHAAARCTCLCRDSSVRHRNHVRGLPASTRTPLLRPLHPSASRFLSLVCITASALPIRAARNLQPPHVVFSPLSPPFTPFTYSPSGERAGGH